MFSLKVRQIGNSIGLVLPKEAAAELNIGKGDTIHLTKAPDGNFHITPYDPEFERQMQTGERLMKKYRNVLRVLAK